MGMTLYRMRRATTAKGRACGPKGCGWPDDADAGRGAPLRANSQKHMLQPIRAGTWVGLLCTAENSCVRAICGLFWHTGYT